MIRKLGYTIAGVAAAFVMALGTGNVARADGTDISKFDFEYTVIEVPIGGVREMTVFTPSDCTWYLVGQNSKKTYLENAGKSGTNKIKIHVGEDETSTGMNIWFYYGTDTDQDIFHDNVCVRFTAPEAPKATAPAQTTAAPASTVTVTLPDGKSQVQLGRE